MSAMKPTIDLYVEAAPFMAGLGQKVGRRNVNGALTLNGDQTEQQSSGLLYASHSSGAQLADELESQGRARLAGCMRCHMWHLVFLELYNRGHLARLTVIAVDSENPPIDYAALHVSRRLPALRIEQGIDVQGTRSKTMSRSVAGLVCESDEDMEELLARLDVEGFRLARDWQAEGEAERVFEDLFRSLSALFKSPLTRSATALADALLLNLARLDVHLARINSTYLLGDELSYADCQLMPKLLHVMVAAKHYRGFEIPASFANVWQYIQAAYSAPSFTESSPTDAAIVAHYRRWASSAQHAVHQPQNAKDAHALRPLSLAAAASTLSPAEVLERARERTSSAPLPVSVSGSVAGSVTGSGATGAGATGFAKTERTSRSGGADAALAASQTQAQAQGPPTQSIRALARQGDAAAAAMAAMFSSGSQAPMREQLASGTSNTIRALARDPDFVQAMSRPKDMQTLQRPQQVMLGGQSQSTTRHRQEQQQPPSSERLSNSHTTRSTTTMRTTTTMAMRSSTAERQMQLQMPPKPNLYEEPEAETYLFQASEETLETSPPKYLKNQRALLRAPSGPAVPRERDREQTYVTTATFNNRTRDAGTDATLPSPSPPPSPPPENDFTNYNYKPTIPTARQVEDSPVKSGTLTTVAVGVSTSTRRAARERDVEVDGAGVGSQERTQRMPRSTRLYASTNARREEAPPPPPAPSQPQTARSRSSSQKTRAPGFYDWSLSEPLRVNASSSSNSYRRGGSREMATQVPRARHASTSTGGEGESGETEEVDARAAKSLRGVKRELRRRREVAKDEEQLEERVERDRTERVLTPTPRSAPESGVDGQTPKPRPLPLPHRWNAATDTVDLKRTLEELEREWASQEQTRALRRRELSGNGGGEAFEEPDEPPREPVPYEPDPRYRLVFPEARAPNAKRAPSPPLGLGSASGEFVEPKYSQWSVPSAHRVTTMVGALEALTTAKRERQVLERRQLSRSTTDLSAVGLEVGPDEDTLSLGRRWGRYDEEYEEEAATHAEPSPARAHNGAEQPRYGYAYAYGTRPQQPPSNGARRLSVGSTSVLVRGVAAREVGAVRVTEGPVVVQSSGAGVRGGPVNAPQGRSMSRGTQSREPREARDPSLGRNEARAEREADSKQQQQQKQRPKAMREYVHRYELF